MNRMSHRLPWLLSLALLASAWAQESDPYGQAMDQATQEVKAIGDRVKAAQDYLGKARAALETAAEELKSSDLDAAQKKAALEKIGVVSKALKDYEGPLKRFTDAVAPVTKAREAWKDLNDLKEQVEKDQQTMGGLAAELRVISKVMTNAGKGVPLIGGFIETYGKMTGGVLDATRKVAVVLAQNWDQEMVGIGAHSAGPARGMNEALKARFPSVWTGDTFAPAQPSWVYLPIGQNQRPQLIWDSAAGTWEIVPEPADAVKIFRMSLRAGQHPDPAALLTLCRHWDQQQTWQNAAREILAFLRPLRRSIDDPVANAFRAVWYHSNPIYQLLEASFEDPTVIEVRYMYDPHFYSALNQLLGRLYQALVDNKANPNVVAQLVALARKYGIQAVLDRIQEETSAYLACVDFAVFLTAPVRVDRSGHKSDPEENGRHERPEVIELQVQNEEKERGECFRLRGTSFEHQLQREYYGVMARYRISGVVATDLSVLKSLTVTYRFERGFDGGGDDRNWSVTLANVPRSPHEQAGEYVFLAEFANRKGFPKGCSVTQARLEYQSTGRRVYSGRPAHPGEEAPNLTETLVETVGGWEASRISDARIRVVFKSKGAK